MSARHLPARDYDAIKAAFRRLVRTCGGPAQAADITRSDKARLSRYGAPDESMNAPVDVVADLEAESGKPEVTRVLADLSGYLLIPQPPQHGDPVWIEHLGALGKEAGEAIARLSQALSNGGTITAEEVRDLELIREVSEAMEVLARIKHALQEVERGAER
jgi:hypothetical protein